MAAHKSGKKGRKIGRHTSRSPAMARYRGEKRWIKNKGLKLVRHLKKHPNDIQTKNSIKNT